MTNPTKDPSFESVENSTIGDGVDYANPLWMTQSGVEWFKYNMESLSRYNTITAGSGSAGLATNGMQLRTGTTADSYSGFIGWPDIYQRRWDGVGDLWSARIPYRIKNAGSEVLIGIGDSLNPREVVDGTHNRDFIGFYFDSGDLKAISCDSTLTSGSRTTIETIGSFTEAPFDVFYLDLKYRQELDMRVEDKDGNTKETYTLSNGILSAGNPDLSPQAWVMNGADTNDYGVDAHGPASMVLMYADQHNL